jgi:hypothetical protein
MTFNPHCFDLILIRNEPKLKSVFILEKKYPQKADVPLSIKGINIDV